MRTTIDLPDDLHEFVRERAHHRRESISKVVADLVRRGAAAPTPEPSMTMRNGVPVIAVGHRVTAEDVASLEDE